MADAHGDQAWTAPSLETGPLFQLHKPLKKSSYNLNVYIPVQVMYVHVCTYLDVTQQYSAGKHRPCG